MSGKMNRRRREERSKELVRRLFLRFIQELRAIFRRHSKEVRESFPDAPSLCKTCAFNPMTDGWRGFDATCDTLRKAIDQDQAFYCHDGMPIVDGEYKPPLGHKMKFCSGWATISGDPETKGAFFRAASQLRSGPS